MTLGLRLQILVLLGLLLGLAFVPLYFAISTYTEVAIERAATRAARQLGRSTATFLANTDLPRSAVERTLFSQREAGERVVAAAVYDANGRLRERFGTDATAAALPSHFTLPASDGTNDPGGQGQLQRVAVSAETERGRATVLIQLGVTDAAPLNRLLGLYITLIGLALLLGAHFSLTALIVRPLDQISRAAGRVASANQPLQLPTTRSTELAALGSSLQTMTQRLKDEELALRRKVEELEQAQAQLSSAQAQLVRSERLASVGQLAAGLAHEVGNPLAAMQGLQDLILDGHSSSEQQLDFTRRMRKETQRISRIIRDLLDFARPETQTDTTEHGDVRASITETLALLKPQPRLRNVEFSLEIPEQLPAVHLGQNRLMQIVLNLVLNAADACDGKGRIELRAELRGANGSSGAPCIRLTVHDDGPGVPPEMVDRIFEPFVSTKEVGEGSGLGLSVCKGLVESIGGKLGLDPTVSRGACFVVELPVHMPAST